MAADAVGYGRGDDYLQWQTQRALIHVLESAAEAAGLHRDMWSRQPAGDGELAVLPPDESESALVDNFVRQLDAGLSRHNRMLLPEARLKLRVAVHFGRLMPGDNGFAGPGLVEVARMLNSGLLRAAVNAAPQANLALLVSDNIYRDTIEPLHTTLRPSEFRRVRVAEKGLEVVGWLWVPGYDVGKLQLPVN